MYSDEEPRFAEHSNTNLQITGLYGQVHRFQTFPGQTMYNFVIIPRKWSF